MSMIEQLGKTTPLFSLLMKMKGQLDNKSDANRSYESIYPILEELLDKGYSFDSIEIQAIVELLREMPAWGAKRANFEKLYLQNESTLRKLPRDPRSFDSQGVWH
ncbi:hypothetical protein ACTFQF_10785 [Aliivibrio fischeri]|uniref:hypothetical protein n=2 Tax=Aliivibrio fischeri TaxID=668 RepID=UPI000B0DD839|nr:hypothetical protein [Aliivibrio fischeri]MBP3141606.1 hypothetical protein [Aliivibrio fischeri]MBP3157775.1 hypothetical protein [Aliivibrio fischeri]MCE7572594.1 hypothetical protein [Aliivibrio fischeri]MUK93771.1 hypothetical protein [Aliivibrio fischeri]